MFKLSFFVQSVSSLTKLAVVAVTGLAVVVFVCNKVLAILGVMIIGIFTLKLVILAIFVAIGK